MNVGDTVLLKGVIEKSFGDGSYQVMVDSQKSQSWMVIADRIKFYPAELVKGPIWQRLQEAEKIIERLSRTMVANLTVEALNYSKKWKPPGVDNLRKVLKDMSDSVADDLKGKIILEDSYAKDADIINLTYKNKFPQTPQDDELDAMTEDVMGHAYRQSKKMQADGQSPKPEDARKFMHNYLAPFPEESNNEKP